MEVTLQIKEDVHFLIDNAHPNEIEALLRCASSRQPYTVTQLREILMTELGYSAQRNLTLSTRRLCDLGLAINKRTDRNEAGYLLTQKGVQIRNLIEIDPVLATDVLHYLHYNGYDGSPEARKLFWSYRICCEVVWNLGHIPPTSELTAEVQQRIASEFPEIYGRKVGGNFNAGGVSAWKAWVTRLDPSPFDETKQTIVPRTRQSFEVALLALDHVYRKRGYRYGDPVVVDDVLLDELARVFFLDIMCCRDLLGFASKVTKTIVLADTFAGTSVRLLAPYDIANL